MSNLLDKQPPVKYTQLQDEEQMNGQQKKEKVSKFQQFLSLFSPQTISETGAKRLVSVDFMRGVAIFIMMISHHTPYLSPMNDETSFFEHAVFYVFMAPVGIFVGHKTLFVLISGISHAYVFGSTALDKSMGKAVIGQLIGLLGSILALPLFYMFHITYDVVYKSQFGQLHMTNPTWHGTDVYSHPPIFFGILTIINQIFMLVVYFGFKALMQIKKLKIYQVLWIMSGILFGLAIIMLFAFMPIAIGLRHAMERWWYLKIPTAIHPVKLIAECPGNFFENTQESFGIHVRNIIAHFLAGVHMSLNPQFLFFLAGAAIGFFLVAFKIQKKECKSQDEYTKLRKWYLRIFNYSPIFMCCVGLLLWIQVNYQADIGLRRPAWTHVDFFKEFAPQYCLLPEYCAFGLAWELFCFVGAFYFFEEQTKQECKIRAQKILFFRRLATYSFSCFIFCYAVSFVLNVIFNVSEKSLTIYGLIGYVVLHQLSHYLIECWIDKFGGNFTPDHMIKRFMHMFNPKKEFKTVADQHLDVCPISLFSKDL